MQRKDFLTRIFGASLVPSMDGFSSLLQAISHMDQAQNKASKFASFGAIHLNNTNLEKATLFWTQIAGMKLRGISEHKAEFGTENQTLVVVHQTAKKPVKKGYSGLYHIAIHAPNEAEFASMLHRLIVNRYPYSPVDHTMSKSLYLDDPDGINIEFTLETPERFKRVLTTGGLRMEGTDGTIRSGSDYLDVKAVLTKLVDTDVHKIISPDTYVGHIHLYANHVQNAKAFYQKIGFIPFNDLPQFMYADLGAGGPYKHRIALNSWHGMNRPLAPSEHAGMNHFHLIFHTQEKIAQALSNLSEYEEKEGGYWFHDPTGNRVFLTHA